VPSCNFPAKWFSELPPSSISIVKHIMRNFLTKIELAEHAALATGARLEGRGRGLSRGAGAEGGGHVLFGLFCSKLRLCVLEPAGMWQLRLGMWQLLYSSSFSCPPLIGGDRI